MMRRLDSQSGSIPESEKSIPSASDSAEPDKESDRGVQVFSILALATAGMACLISLLPAAGHDQMWCLYAAKLVLHGTKLYGPQLVESNPPLIVWLSLVPATLAEWLHLPSTTVGKFLILLLEVAVATLGWRLLRNLRPRLGRPASCALAFGFIAIFAVMPARDFGQRDHILALLCLPYLLTAARFAEGLPLQRWEAIGVGVAAGIGIALKPHQALIPIAVEITLLLLVAKSGRRPGWKRPEPFAIAVVGALYLFCIHVFNGDYLTGVLPVLRSAYWAFGDLTFAQLVTASIQLHILAVVTIAVWFAAGEAPALATLLLSAGVASTLAYDLQGTGWYYQQLPALSFFALALVLLVIDALERHPLTLPRWSLKAAIALSLLALALTTHFAGYPFTADRSFPIDTPDSSFFVGLPPAAPVATLTTTVDYTIPPVFKFGLILAQRSPHLWMLPAILRGESGDPHVSRQQLVQLETLQHRAMREDFDRWKPRLVLVERCQDPAVHCQELEDRHDDLLAWFLRDPQFQQIFAHYHFLRSAGQFDAYVPN
jgi:hypothetical protein